MHILFLALTLSTALAIDDADGDGVLDANDGCPSLAEDGDGFRDEDGCPDPDNDGDGLPDGTDTCPDDAEDHDDHEDEDGCPDEDNDGDGLSDRTDPCPDQAGDGGCPPGTDGFSVPFARLARGVTRRDPFIAEQAFAPEGWRDNLVGPSGLSGLAIWSQAQEEGWTLVPTAPPLMLDPTLAVVPCAVRLTGENGRDLESVSALVLRTAAGWRVLGAGEDEIAVKAVGAAWIARHEPRP